MQAGKNVIGIVSMEFQLEEKNCLVRSSVLCINNATININNVCQGPSPRPLAGVAEGFCVQPDAHSCRGQQQMQGRSSAGQGRSQKRKEEAGKGSAVARQLVLITSRG